MMHTLIVGERGVGKSTLIGNVLAALNRPVRGFATKKEDALEEPFRGSPVYIYPAGKERERSAENLVGYCKNHCFHADISVFNRFAATLREPVPQGGILLMDELGFMESRAEEFCQTVLTLLDGDVPIIAAVKTRDFPFLNAVRSHPKARCFAITPENRDSLYPEVLAHVLAQFEE